MIDIDKLVEESNGDISALYNKLLTEFNGDQLAVENILDELISQEEDRLEESMRKVEEGKEFLTRSKSIEATREEKAYWTQREYFKTLYHGKDDKVVPKTKLAKEKALKLEEENKKNAIDNYYSNHSKEAQEDNIII